MLGKKMMSFKKLAKKVKGGTTSRVDFFDTSYQEGLLTNSDCRVERCNDSPSAIILTGFVPVYVGEDRRRYVVPTSFLSHPLFKMLLERAYNEFGFQQRSGLVVPCSVSAFEEVVNAVACCHGQFHFGELVEEFIS